MNNFDSLRGQAGVFSFHKRLQTDCFMKFVCFCAHVSLERLIKTGCSYMLHIQSNALDIAPCTLFHHREKSRF